MRFAKPFIQLSIVFTAFFTLSACSNIVSGLFGASVDVDENDSTPPSVRFVIPKNYLRPDTLDFVVSTETATASAAGRSFTYTVVGEDFQGVRAVTLRNIGVTPWCAARPRGRAPVPPTPRPATTFILFGDTVEQEAVDGRASTRLPLIRSFSLNALSMTFGEEFDRCPEDRPVLFGAEVRFVGAARNFGGRTVETAPAIVRMGLTVSGGAPIGGRIGGGSGSSGGTCAGEGDPCTTQLDVCSARGDDFDIPGRIVCRNGDAVCEPRRQEDYCVDAGFACGGGLGAPCVQDSDCGPTLICGRSESASGGKVCRGLLGTERSSGLEVCDPPNNMCWLPSEVADAGIRAIVCGSE
ncbi:MAG: hypothetical protein AAGC95_08920 [Pseudomonadota bacterium]